MGRPAPSPPRSTLPVAAAVALWAAALCAAPSALAGQVRGTVVFPLIAEDTDSRPEERRPLASWRLENGHARINRDADVHREVVVVLEPQQPVRIEPQRVLIESRSGGALEPLLSVAQTGVSVIWRNSDSALRAVTLEDGDTLLPPEPASPGATREVRFSIPGEYVFLDPDHPFSRATVVVVGSAFAARTDDRGAFALDVPDGRYRLRTLFRGRWTDLQTLDVGGRSREITIRLGIDEARPPASPSPPAAASKAASPPAADTGEREKTQ
jgi:hypothetical protein